MKLWRLPCVLLAALALPASVALSDGLIRDGLGPISTGRGGTNIGFADNGAILNDNPAGMVNMSSQNMLDFAIETPILDMQYTNPGNTVQGGNRPIPLPMGAIMHKSDDGNWAYGIGVFAPAGFSAQFDMQNTPIGPSYYRSFGALAKILPGISYKVTDRLSIGGTLGLAISDVELDGPVFFQTGPLAGVPALLHLNGLGVAPTGSVGMQYIWNDNTTFGINYISQSRFNLAGHTSAEAFGVAPVPLASTFDSNVHLVWPSSLGFGVVHRINRYHRVSCDLIWYQWSSAFNQFGLSFTNASNPIFTGLLGPVIRDIFPMNWIDTVSTKLGYEFMPTDLDIYRFGFVYHASPAPSSTLNPYTDGILEYAFSTGYSRKFRRASLNAAYQYSFGHTRHIDASSLVGGNFDNSTFRAQVHWVSLGFTVPF